ncbi:hypothetical protein AE1304_14890 [Aeromonas enteropelogenes]
MSDLHGSLCVNALLGLYPAPDVVGVCSQTDGAQFVKSYVKTNKYDAADTEVINNIAVIRLNMWLISIKMPEQ